MKLDDESILSAYVDGELDADQVGLVERAILDDPALALRVRSIAATSELVANLSRSAAPCGLSSTVLARIASEGAGSRERRPVFWLATAAGIVFASILTLRSGLIGGPARVGTAPIALATARPIAPPPTPPEIPAVTVPEVVATSLPDPLGPVAAPDDAARREIVEILDRPGVHRLLIVVDVLDPAARDRVQGLLRDTARKSPRFGRISVPQGIVIDPEYPNEAEVFTAMMDGPEFDDFVGRIGPDVAQLVHDTRFDPSMGTQLADQGRASTTTGLPAAGLIAPPVDPRLGHKFEPSPPPEFQERHFVPDGVGSGEFARIEGGRSADDLPAVPKSEGATVRIEPRPRSKGPVPVLVWVTTHDPRRTRN